MGGCHAGRGKQLLCLGGICSSYQSVTSESIAPQKNPSTPPNAGVKKLSGAQTIFAQLLHERGAPHAQQSRRLGDGAVGFYQRLANESDFYRRQVILQIDPAARQFRAPRLCAVGEVRRG